MTDWLAVDQKQLHDQISSNKLPHAIIFSGVKGAGKLEIAQWLVKRLLCQQPSALQQSGVLSACTQCKSCHLFNSQSHPDHKTIELNGLTIGVDQVRTVSRFFEKTSQFGNAQTIIISDAEKMTESAANALLKTLEEPPPHVKFLLATTDPQKLPVTVLSRCLQFNLKNMIPQRIVEHLSTVLSAEQIPFEEGALWLLARSADGSMRDALSLTDQSIAFGAGTVNEADVRVMLGSIDLQLVNEILTALVDGDGVSLLACVDDLAQFSPDYNTVLGDIVSLLHRIAIAQTVPAALDNSMGDKQQVAELASKLSAEDVQLFYQIALMGRKDLPFVPDAREGLEMTLLRMLAFRPAGSTHVKPAPLMVSPANAEQNNEKVEPNEAAVPLSSVSTAPVATTK